MVEIIINADDFGISKGVNEAIVEMFKAGNLTSASFMISGKYALDAVKKIEQNPALKVGLHFNLTTGKSILHHISLPLLTAKDGSFKNGFLKLLLLSIFKKREFLAEVEAELKAQISMANYYNIKFEHIDGHRHIHYIFGIFKLVQKVAKLEGINRVRVVNESLFDTIIATRKLPSASGLLKWGILRFLGLFNGAREVKNVPYFFSILYSCRMNNSLFNNFKLKKGYNAIEVMLHPSITEFDVKDEVEYEKPHLLSKLRTEEFNFIKPKL